MRFSFDGGSTGENDFSLDEPLSFRMIFRLDIYFPSSCIGFLKKFCEDKSKRPKHRMTGGRGKEISYRPLTLGTHRNTPKTAF